MQIRKYNTISDIYNDNIPNKTTFDSLVKAWHILNMRNYKKPLCSISGGSDSDVLLDIIYKCDVKNMVTYVFVDTGLEMPETKEHLDWLENKYQIKIRRIRPKTPIPLSCKKNGVPFLDKVTSENIHRLQLHNFQWEDEPFEVLYEKYPKCKSALEWWCNKKKENGKLGIAARPYLKEFLIQNPPPMLISQSCCTVSKKTPVHTLIDKEKYDLDISGVRKAEGGARSVRYKSCFDGDNNTYRPLFWFSDTDKKQYEEAFNLTHSKCYTEYCLIRTGCVGCPFAGKRRSHEIEIMEQVNPQMAKAANNIFGQSYEYQDQYYKFIKKMKRGEIQKNGLIKHKNGQLSFDI